METVLVVEEDAHQRLLYEWEFSDSGYGVMTAASMDEADEKVINASPDCIVLGIERRSREVLAGLRRFLGSIRDVPVVVNTTYNDCGGTLVRSLVDDCVIKSSNVEELKERIRKVLEIPRPSYRAERTMPFL